MKRNSLMSLRGALLLGAAISLTAALAVPAFADAGFLDRMKADIARSRRRPATNLGRSDDRPEGREGQVGRLRLADAELELRQQRRQQGRR